MFVLQSVKPQTKLLLGAEAMVLNHRPIVLSVSPHISAEHHPVTLLRCCEDTHDRHAPILVFPLVHGEVPSRKPQLEQPLKVLRPSVYRKCKPRWHVSPLPVQFVQFNNTVHSVQCQYILYSVF